MTPRHARPARPLPSGERLLWQGAPDAERLARSAFHARAIALYFATLAAFAIALGHGAAWRAALVTAAGGVAAVALLHLLAWLAARTTTYTLTDRRIVLRVGAALPKSVNLPLAKIAAVDLSERGDIALRLTETPPIGWLMLWPHARPWRLGRPEPMLRCLAESEAVARLIAGAALALEPQPQPQPDRAARAAAAAPSAIAA